MKLTLKKYMTVIFVLAVAMLMVTSCLDTEGGVLTARRSVTQPAKIANIPVGSTLVVNVDPGFEILWEYEPEEIYGAPFTNSYIEQKYEDYFSINGGAEIGTIYYSPFRRGGVTPEFLKEQVEASFEYYLTTDKGFYFYPNAEDKKSVYSTVPVDFHYDTWPYEPFFVAGGEGFVPTFVMAEDPATADYTLDIHFTLDSKVYQVIDFPQQDGYLKDYWDEDHKHLKQNGDVYMWYDILMNYKLINNATGETVCDIMTPQADSHIKTDSKYSIFNSEFLTNTDDPATFLNSYDFKDKAVDLILSSIESVIPRLRVLWYCNSDDMTMVYPEAEDAE